MAGIFSRRARNPKIVEMMKNAKIQIMKLKNRRERVFPQIYDFFKFRFKFFMELSWFFKSFE